MSLDITRRLRSGRATRPMMLLAALFVVALLASGCTMIVTDGPKPPASHALPPKPGGPLEALERAFVARAATGQSGFRVLDAAEDALLWRLALIDSAAHTLDLQYYLWYEHDSGLLMMTRVRDAADRGVRVRLILDDMDTDGTESLLAIVEGHPNVEVRLFNPFRFRAWPGRAIELAERLERLNRRMHNKLLLADGRAVIVGGRNVGDAYFGLDPDLNFRDLDLLGVGPVARQGAHDFDRFWNSDWVVSAAALASAATPEDRARLESRLETSPSLARFPPRPADWRAALADLAPTLHAGTASASTDTPRGDFIARRTPAAVRAVLRSAQREVQIVNAYVIPDEALMADLRALVRRGVPVRLLTNSLASSDVPAVNGHYKRFRRPLIDAGVELFETRPDAAIRTELADTPPIRARHMGQHAKAIVIDQTRVFIGSMNLDPRSTSLNSETGIIVESASLGETVAGMLERDMRPENAWRVTLAPDGELRWIAGEEELVFEPARSLWQRVKDGLAILLPPDFY
jgi:putative cardiolipin synthase